MVTSSTTKTKATRPAKRDERLPTRRPGPSKPFLRYFHSEDLRKRTLSILALLEKSADATDHRGALADVVVDLMKSGLDYYFMGPLKKAKAGFVIEQSAKMGLMGAQQVIGSVIRNIIGRMEAPQLLSVCGSIREFME